MADFWKSQPRHFCEFCKCWIADNKPSREYHEKGKKHLENVKLRVEEARKKGEKNAKKEEEMKESLKEMEEEALRTLKEDLKRDPSLAAAYGVTIKQKERPVQGPSLEGRETSKASEEAEKEESTEDTSDTDNPELWSETVSPEGYTYYWHTVTGEVTWIKPKGYFSPEEKLKIQQEKEKAAVEKRKEDKEKRNAEKRKIEAEKAATSSERVPEPISDFGPQPKATAYGGWETIKEEEPPEDLQLPEVDQGTEVAVATVSTSEPKIKFRQKKVDTLGAEFVAFKKRKLNKGNMKQREDR